MAASPAPVAEAVPATTPAEALPPDAPAETLPAIRPALVPPAPLASPALADTTTEQLARELPAEMALGSSPGNLWRAEQAQRRREDRADRQRDRQQRARARRTAASRRDTSATTSDPATIRTPWTSAAPAATTPRPTSSSEPSADRTALATGAPLWSRDGIIAELANWVLGDRRVEPSFVDRYGPPGLVAAALRVFGDFEAALDIARSQVATLYPDAPAASPRKG